MVMTAAYEIAIVDIGKVGCLTATIFLEDKPRGHGSLIALISPLEYLMLTVGSLAH